MLYNNVCKYVGYFTRKRFRGEGKMWFWDGNYFEGEFLRGERHGKGRFVSRLGIEYWGEWEKGHFLKFIKI